MIDANSGWERDRLETSPGAIRWWFYVTAPDVVARPQAPRQGVGGNGFTFARGGRCTTAEEAEQLVAAATAEAAQEWRFWRGQPSHLLDVSTGQLVPLGETASAALPERSVT